MRWLLASCLALSLLTGARASAQAPHPEIWFNPNVPVDWLNMWTKDAPWQEAATKVKVLTLEYNFVRYATDAQILQIVDFIRSHGMRLNLDTQPVAKFQTETCGGIEGYTYHGEIQEALRTLVRLGIQIDWVNMDEPLWFGRYEPGPKGCQLSIPDLITRTALNMQDVVAAFPRVRIMEIEPIPALTKKPDWRGELAQFQLGLARILGTAITSVHADVGWGDPAWRSAVVEFNKYLRQRNIDFGIIFNASGANTTDAAWINAAVGNMDEIEGKLGVIPTQANFSTWNANPTHNMPETSPLTQTWLINRYIRPISSLVVQFSGGDAVGKLTSLQGTPITNATINGYIPGSDFRQPLSVTTAQGVVPVGATRAILGVRINAECNGCNGLNDLLLGRVQYLETQNGTAQGSLMLPTTPLNVNGVVVDGQLVGGTTVTRVIAGPGQALIRNSGPFPVTAGARFQLAIPAGTVNGRGWFGNIDVIWLNANGEISRFVVVPPPGKMLVSTAITAADGTFRLAKMPRQTYYPNPVTVEFDGLNGTYRGAVWSPLR